MRVEFTSKVLSLGPCGSVNNRDKLLGLQALRGVAAVLVVLHHVTLTLALPKYTGIVIMGGIFEPLGRAGVDLFFVLSGFIIYYVHHGDIGEPARLHDYAVRRLIRIYPTYWAVLLLLLAVLFAVPSLGKGLDRQPLVIIKSALLIPFTDRQPIVGVAWTLSHELLFYGLFAVAIANGRVGAQIFAGWFLCLIVASPFSVLPQPLNFFLHVKNLEFFIGMAVARVLLSERFKPGWFVLLAGALGFVAVGVIERQGFDFQLSAPTLLYGIAAGVMILALATLEAQGRLPAVPRFLVLLGGASYSIYLIHFTVVVATIKAAHAAQIPAWALLLLPTVTSVGILAGLALHALIERPVLRMARRLPNRLSTPAIRRFRRGSFGATAAD